MYLIYYILIYGIIMTKKKNAPLPASSAGLLRFFEDETKGFKVRPEIVLGITGALIGVSLIIRVVFPV
jgi:preprotein translocase subunit Sec61beta